jgi:hypothetical protein
LGALRARLAANGHALVFITRRNWLTRPLIGRWWQSNLYDKGELLEAFGHAGFSQVRSLTFPLGAIYLGMGRRHRSAQIRHLERRSGFVL